VLIKPLKLAALSLIVSAGVALFWPKQAAVVADSSAKLIASYTAVDEFTQPKFAIAGNSLFHDQTLPGASVSFSEQKLLKVVVNTRAYFSKFAAEDPVINRAGVLATQGVTIPKVLETLDYMTQVLKEDMAQGRPTRLRDPQFINQNFRVIRWSPYNPRDRQHTETLRVTKYAVFIQEGSRKKTSKFNTPLYALPDSASTDLFYKQYTKQDVLSGIYEPGGKAAGKVQPLAYLTRAAFEEALMQGTVLVRFGGGSSAYFNVDRNNGIAYVKGLEPIDQKRYWYFRPVKAIKGYGNKIQNKIDIEPSVTFAGDVFNLGLGKIVVLDTGRAGQKRLILGVVADTGGAFIPNLYQLDYLAGLFPDRQTFSQQTGYVPDFVKAYILVKK
jgi:hypothetical protein